MWFLLQDGRIKAAMRAQVAHQLPIIRDWIADSSRSTQDVRAAGSETGSLPQRPGQDYRPLAAPPGISVVRDQSRHQTTSSSSKQHFVVGWEGPADPVNPRNKPLGHRLGTTLQISLLALVVIAASGTVITALPQAAADFGVSQVVETLATGLFLCGMGIGSLVAGPFCETFGRSLVYVVSLAVFMVWILGAALAPNIAAQLCFRFLAGCCASTPLVCTGGSISDMFTPVEKCWAFPVYAIISFGGPMVGAVVSAYIGPSETLSWRWVEWIVLIAAGALLLTVICFMPETYGPLLLQWKAEQLRLATGDDRFVSESELSDATLLSRLRISMTRPFLMITEPIIIAMTAYITVVYIVLFTFLVGWPYIFEYPYGISQGLAHTIFVAMFVGVQLNFLATALVYPRTIKKLKASAGVIVPEVRLTYAMVGAVSFPVSLFWMGWTARSSISIWSPILASGLFGFAITGIFISVYMYIIDAYEVYAASALTFVSFVRYLVAGGMTVAGLPIYRGLGTAYTLTILGCLAAVLAPVPFLLHYQGHRLRKLSRYAHE